MIEKERVHLESIVILAILSGASFLDRLDMRGIKFTQPLYAIVYKSYLEVLKNGEDANLATLPKYSDGKLKGSQMVGMYNHLSEQLPHIHSGVVQHAINELKRYEATEATAEQILEVAALIQQGEDVTEFFPKLTKSLIDNLPKSVDKDAKDEAKHLIDIINLNKERLAKDPHSILGIPTGYTDLDYATEGLRYGQVWVIGGVSSAGKTTLGLNILNNVVSSGHRAVMYSLEMSKEKVYFRLLSMRSQESTHAIEKGKLDKQKYKQIFEDFKSLPLRVVDTHTSHVDDIIADIIYEHKSNNTKIFMIDYIQLVDVGSDESEYRQISYVIREFQKIATRLNVVLIVLSQMANAYLKEAPGGVPLYKGSGNIFFVSNVALELQHDLKKEALDELRYFGKPIPKKITMHKNRDGQIKTSYLLDYGSSGYMKPLSKSEYDTLVTNANDNVDTDLETFFQEKPMFRVNEHGEIVDE